MKSSSVDDCRDLLMGRMTKRKNHFMPANMLDSQLETLEKHAASHA